jgi:hypothetical protein
MCLFVVQAFDTAHGEHKCNDDVMDTLSTIIEARACLQGRIRKQQYVIWHACYADVAGLQRADGSFTGDKWGEVDTR